MGMTVRHYLCLACSCPWEGESPPPSDGCANEDCRCHEAWREDREAARLAAGGEPYVPDWMQL